MPPRSDFISAEASPAFGTGRLSETGLIYVSVLLLLISTLDLGIFGLLIKLLWVISYGLLCVTNIGSALGIYIFSIVLYNPKNTVLPGPLWEELDILALLIFVLGVLLFFSQKGLFRESKKSLLLIGIFVGPIVLQAAVKGNLNMGVLAEFLRMFGLPFGIFLLVKSAPIGRREIDSFFKVMMVLGLYLAVVAVFERLDLRSLILPGWIADPEINLRIDRGRSGGPFMQSEFNGLAMGLIMVMYWASAYFRRTGPRLLKSLGILACLVGIYLTYTRAAWLAAVLALVLLISARSGGQAGLPKKAFLVLPLLVLISLIVVTSSQLARERFGDVETVNSRASIWGTALRMAIKRPLFGYGFASFNKIAPDFRMTTDRVTDAFYLEGEIGTHNILINILAEQGVIGLVLFGLVLAQFYRSALKGSEMVWPKAGKVWLIAFAAAYLVNAQFANMHEPATNVMFYGTLGLLAGFSDDAPEGAVGADMRA